MRVLQNGEIIGSISTNQNLTPDQALYLLGFELVHDENEGDHYQDAEGREVWAEEITMEY
jgi:hypothetical protein